MKFQEDLMGSIMGSPKGLTPEENCDRIKEEWSQLRSLPRKKKKSEQKRLEQEWAKAQFSLFQKMGGEFGI